MNAKKKFTESLKKELEQRKSLNLFRTLKPLDTNQIDFSSNDYLGLNFDQKLNQFLEEIIHDYKERTVGSTGSRLISGHRTIYEVVEKQFSEYTHTESALLFHSGFVANVSSIFALLSPSDYAFVDRLCHASILDGIRISGAKKVYFNHNDMNHLEEQIKKSNSSSKSFRWIFTEAVFSMDGDIPPLEQLVSIAKQYECNLFIDEAHSIGILGNRGIGLTASKHLQNEFTVITYPMGKAPGMMGCFVCGNSILKDYLINHARGFIYSTAQPIILIYLLKRIIEYLESEEAEIRRKHVEELSKYTRNALKQNDFDIGLSESHIIPIILKEEEKVIQISQKLREKNFNVVGIRPPSVPKNTSRIRLNIHAHNTPEQIDRLIEELLFLRDKTY
jgi:8-amino-7-oxononanoate synthase